MQTVKIYDNSVIFPKNDKELGRFKAFDLCYLMSFTDIMDKGIDENFCTYSIEQTSQSLLAF